jgi:hypothetical protein
MQAMPLLLPQTALAAPNKSVPTSILALEKTLFKAVFTLLAFLGSRHPVP